MIDPVTAATLWVLWGKLAEPIIADACKDHLKGKLANFFFWLEGHGKKDELQAAYEEAMHSWRTKVFAPVVLAGEGGIIDAVRRA